MKTVTINDIEVYYDDSKKAKIDYIKKVITNNYNLFLSILGKSPCISLSPTDNENTLYIPDFDNFFITP